MSCFIILFFFFCGFKFLVQSRKLCEAPYNKTVDWAKWYVFWADERAVAKNHSDSNYKLAKDGLLSKVFKRTLCILLFYYCCTSIMKKGHEFPPLSYLISTN